MALETGTYISDLVSTNPTASDAKSQGDDHIRLLKSTVKATFPNITGAVTATHTQLNTVPNLAPIASPAFTDVPTAPTATVGTSTTQLATTAFVQAAALAASGVPSQSGNSGKFLTTDGSSASWASTGLTLLATLTPTAAANVDFLTTFTSTYDNYLIVLEGILPASSDTLRMCLAVSGSATLSSNYFTGENATNLSATTSWLLSAEPTLSTGKGIGGTLNLQNANDATNAKTASSEFIGQSTATPYFNGFTYRHAFNSASVVTGFRLFWAGGSNFSATGKARVYGYSNT